MLHNTTELKFLVSTQMFPEYFPPLKLHHNKQNHYQWAKTSIRRNTPHVKNDKKNDNLFLNKKKNK